MATAWTSRTFPQFEHALRTLTERHRELEDEPLYLALSYASARDQQDIFLLEVIGGDASISPDGDLFEATFESVPGLATGFDQPLHLVLTNPAELKQAMEEGWPLAKEILAAIRAEDYRTLYKDTVGDRLLRQIRAAAKRPGQAQRG